MTLLILGVKVGAHGRYGISDMSIRRQRSRPRRRNVLRRCHIRLRLPTPFVMPAA
jgi:hypothetical protein